MIQCRYGHCSMVECGEDNCGYFKATSEPQTNIHTLGETVGQLQKENARMREALKRIAKWFGEFPPSERKWDDGTPMSYLAVFGAKGERDFMRQVAVHALHNANLTGGEVVPSNDMIGAS